MTLWVSHQQIHIRGGVLSSVYVQGQNLHECSAVENPFNLFFVNGIIAFNALFHFIAISGLHRGT
jgi:hypothetical protein